MNSYFHDFIIQIFDELFLMIINRIEAKGFRNHINYVLSVKKAFYRTKDQSQKAGIWRINPEHSSGIFKRLKLKNLAKRPKITTTNHDEAEPDRKMVKIEASNDDLVKESEEMIENEGEKDTESESKMGFQFHFLALQENSNDFEPKQLAIDPSTKVSQNFQRVAFFLKI